MFTKPLFDRLVSDAKRASGNSAKPLTWLYEFWPESGYLIFTCAVDTLMTKLKAKGLKPKGRTYLYNYLLAEMVVDHVGASYDLVPQVAEYLATRPGQKVNWEAKVMASSVVTELQVAEAEGEVLSVGLTNRLLLDTIDDSNANLAKLRRSK